MPFPRPPLPPLPPSPFNRSEPPLPTPTPKPTPHDPDELGIVMKRRGPTPTWLKPHQERLAAANRKAAAQTRHLKGVARVLAMNRLTAEYMRDDGKP